MTRPPVRKPATATSGPGPLPRVKPQAAARTAQMYSRADRILNGVTPQNCVTTDRDRVDDSAESIVVDWPNQESSPPAIWPRNATEPVEIPA